MENNINFKVRVSCYTFNHAPYIVDAMNSFAMQKTTFPFVCTIVDDASTDGEAGIIVHYIEEHFNMDDTSHYRCEETDDYRLIFAQHKENGNCYFVAILLKYNHYSIGKAKYPYYKEWSNTKYIAFCEGDDFWIAPDKLQAQYDVMEHIPECTICFNRVQVVEVDSVTKRNQIPLEKAKIKQGYITMQTVVDEELIGQHWCFHTCSFFLKQEICTKYIDFRKKILNAFPYDDMPIIMYALISGKGYFIDKVMGCYRYMSGGWNSTLKNDKKKAKQIIMKVVEGYNQFDEYTNLIYHKGIQRRNNRSIFFGIYKGFNLHPKYWVFYPELAKIIINKIIKKWKKHQL